MIKIDPAIILLTRKQIKLILLIINLRIILNFEMSSFCDLLNNDKIINVFFV